MTPVSRMAASVSTSSASRRPTRCSTRNERSATFHSATPRGSRTTRSRSVTVRRSNCRVVSASEAAWPKTTRVSVSASRPSASRCWAEPAAPAARRSDNRWTTATLATPTARASLNVACNHRAVARSCRTAQASSTTTSRLGPPPLGQHRLQPAGGAGHQDGQRRGGEHGRQVQRHDRRVQAQAGRGRPVEHPGQIALHQPAQLQRHQAAVLGQPGGVGAYRGRQLRIRVQHGPDQTRKRGFGRPGPTMPRTASSTAVRSGGESDPAERGGRQRAGQLGSATNGLARRTAGRARPRTRRPPVGPGRPGPAD